MGGMQAKEPSSTFNDDTSKDRSTEQHPAKLRLTKEELKSLGYRILKLGNPQYQKEKASIAFNRRWFLSTGIIATLCFALAVVIPILSTGIVILSICCGLALIFGVFLGANKAPYRAKKQLIIDNKPLIKIANEEDQKPFRCSDAICSQIYYEGKNQPIKDAIKASFQKQIEACSSYKDAPLIAPLMAVIALVALGKHNNPPLKVILSVRDNVGHFSIHSSPLGVFMPVTSPNTLFITFQRGSSKTIANGISTFFHEASHFAANLLMNNLSNPYSKIDDEVEIQYLAILKKLNEPHLFENWKTASKNNKKQLEVIENFEHVFISYSERNQPSELFVLLAQTIAILGYEDGINWLNSHIPDLVEFWASRFNPACLDYLKNHNAQQYLALDKQFTQAINQNTYKPPSAKLSLPIHIWRTFRSLFSQATLLQISASLSKFPLALGLIIIALAIIAIILNFVIPTSMLATMPLLATIIQLLEISIPVSCGLIGHYAARPIFDKIFAHTDVQSVELLLAHLPQTGAQISDKSNDKKILSKEEVLSKEVFYVTDNKEKSNSNITNTDQPWRILYTQ
jgi:hypothetical protein